MQHKIERRKDKEDYKKVKRKKVKRTERERERCEEKEEGRTKEDIWLRMDIPTLLYWPPTLSVYLASKPYTLVSLGVDICCVYHQSTESSLDAFFLLFK